VSPVRAIPTSRAYWELRAEQVLNRVFSPEVPIDVEVREPNPAAAHEGTSVQTGQSRSTSRSAQRPRSGPPLSNAPASGMSPSDTWLLAGISLLVTLTTGFTLLGLTLWQQSQQSIRQERSMLLVERLRALGPAVVAPPAPELASSAQVSPSPQALPEPPGGEMLTPPPVEPWMEELASLPATSAPPSRVLQVPMSSKVSRPAPPAQSQSPGPGQGAGMAPPTAAPVNVPQLVGVVQVPGQAASAIFQLDGSSTSAASGEAIGSSGWRLVSASGDAAVIERQGLQKRISISSGF
jgi:hypothetical protein